MKLTGTAAFAPRAVVVQDARKVWQMLQLVTALVARSVWLHVDRSVVVQGLGEVSSVGGLKQVSFFTEEANLGISLDELRKGFFFNFVPLF